MRNSLWYQAVYQGTGLTIELAGCFDGQDVFQIREIVATMYARGFSQVILDFDKVVSLGDEGLLVLYQSYDLARRSNRQFGIINPSPDVLQLLKQTQSERIIYTGESRV
ncbi:MAG: STAS domain-containing protein [Patescibacteria group bacterium]